MGAPIMSRNVELQCTIAGMGYADGRGAVGFDIGRGRLRGPKGKRYFDWNAKDTTNLGRVAVCVFPRTHGWHAYTNDIEKKLREPFNGIHQDLAKQYESADYPAIDWNL